MPGEEQKPGVTTEKIEGIPLYLIPKAIADQIKKKGEAVFQIIVERKFHHRYTVKVETFDEHAQRVNQENLPPKKATGMADLAIFSLQTRAGNRVVTCGWSAP